MALFVNKPVAATSVPGYTVGLNKVLLIVGLGNPGTKYSNNRHNVGFSIVNSFATQNDFPNWSSKADLSAQLTARNLGQAKVILAKPTTFMNDSGLALGKIQSFYKVPGTQTLVVYDELDLPFGQIRARFGGNDAGHNGVKSLIQHSGEDFFRLKVGISNEHSQAADSAKFVLSDFNKEEKGSLGQVVAEATAMVTEFIFSGHLPHDTRSINQ